MRFFDKNIINPSYINMNDNYQPPFYQRDRFDFNYAMWIKGKETEDKILPHLNVFFDCDFKRSEEDKFDKLDFRDDDKKIIVEVKGRKCKHNRYVDTIITTGKIRKAQEFMVKGYKVYYFFVFCDKTMYIEQPTDIEWSSRITGTWSIPHYLIPISSMEVFNIE